ncbi:MAG: hypothetical protein V3W18_05795 [candidate division Zixibacteria bacterium]
MRFLILLKRIRWLALCVAITVVLSGCTTKSPEIELPMAPVSMTLSAEDSIIEAGGGNTTISAILFDQHDDPLGDGYSIRFTITQAPSMIGEERPSFEYQSTEDSALFEIDIITDNNGMSSIELYSGTAPGPVRIKAVALDNTSVFAEEHLVTVVIGGPASLILGAEDSIIEAGGENTTISAILFDHNDDPLGDGFDVRFTITQPPSMIGEERPSFEHQSTEDSALFETDVVTDSNSIASVELYSGTAPGPIRIRAVSLDDTDVFTEEHLVTVAIGGPASLVLGAVDSAIEVGRENTTVHVTIFGEFNDNMGEGYGVRLEITEYPGTHGADPPSFDYPASEDSISHIYEGITDVDGRIEVELFSGYVPGWVKIRATIIEYENISVEESLVMIEPGPPAFVSISLGAVAESAGDSLYIPLGVGIWDRYANPAGFGIPVYIEIEPDSIVDFENVIYTEHPEYPDSAGGWASTQLGYICDHSLETIRIIVSAGEVADTSSVFPLPVYHPEIHISADPGAIWVSPPDTAGFSDITVRLLDGNGCEISNGIIYFSALVCGEISGQSIDTTDNDGYAYSEFMIHIDDIPGPPPDPPQCTGLIRARFLGYPDTENEVEIICSRPR